MSYNFNGKTGIVCGGTNGIGFAIAKQLLNQNSISKLFILGRDLQSEHLNELIKKYPQNIHCSYFESSKLDSLTLPGELSESPAIDFIVNCVGVLKFESYSPERRLEDITYDQFEKTLQINTYTSLYLAQKFKKQLLKSKTPLFLSISAKVGSIDDNKMGGWYSYRISKAALNMAMKNISIEFKNRNKQSLVITVHPGTTESKLSKPFLEQARKRYKILTTDESAKFIIENLKKENHGHFMSWDKNRINW